VLPTPEAQGQSSANLVNPDGVRIHGLILPLYSVPKVKRELGTLILPRTWVHSLSELSGTIYLVCVSLWRQAAEGHMGSFVVVIGPPFFDALPGIGHRDKPGSVQALGTKPPVERLDEPVVCWLSGP
jgi:hypothetical protein